MDYSNISKIVFGYLGDQSIRYNHSSLKQKKNIKLKRFPNSFIYKDLNDYIYFRYRNMLLSMRAVYSNPMSTFGFTHLTQMNQQLKHIFGRHYAKDQTVHVYTKQQSSLNYYDENDDENMTNRILSIAFMLRIAYQRSTRVFRNSFN